MKADIPEGEHASAHRMISNMAAVSSARRKMATCEAKLRANILRSGGLNTKLGARGCSSEPLYAKNVVNDIQAMVIHAIRRV